MKFFTWSFAIGVSLTLLLMPALQAFAQPNAPPAVTHDWPQFRGPNRDGTSTETGLLTQWPEGGPKLLWSDEGIGKGFSHPAVAGGLIYVTGMINKEGILRAYKLDGQRAWEVKYGPEYDQAHPGARSTPTVHDGLVYIVSAFGQASCFTADAGKPVWSVNLFEKYDAKPIMWGFSDNVLIDGDNAIVSPCGSKAAIVALNRKTGEQVWASKPIAKQSGFCSPLIINHHGMRMLVTITDSAVVALVPETGAVIWQHRYQNSNRKHCNTPIYHDGMLYVTSGYGKGAIGLTIADDGKSVKQIWEQTRQDPAHGQAVLVDGYIYASSHQSMAGKWSCLDLKTGQLTWQHAGVGKRGSVIYVGGLLYCYSESGMVGLVRPSPESCQVISSFKVPQGEDSHWAHLVVANGRMYIRHGNALMCYDVSASSVAQ